jgi:hypothetical protein
MAPWGRPSHVDSTAANQAQIVRDHVSTRKACGQRSVPTESNHADLLLGFAHFHEHSVDVTSM